MSWQRLSFANIRKLADNITELKIDNDIEVTEAMVDEYHDWLVAHHDDDFAVLINKTNSYTYTFTAQLKLGRVDKMKVSAFLVKDHSAELAVRSLMDISSRRQIPYDIFYNHNVAVNWLREQMGSQGLPE